MSIERETLLRNLRKEVGRLEEEEKHLKEYVADMEATSRTMETEMHENTQRNAALKSQLTKWRKTLTDALKALPLPGNSANLHEILHRWCDSLHRSGQRR